MKTSRLVVLFILIFGVFLQSNDVVFANEESHLKVDITTDKQEYKEQDEITYTLTISNTSENEANNVIVTSTIPEGLEVTSEDANINGNKVSWHVENMEKAKQVNLEFTAKVEKETAVTPVVEAKVEEDASSGGSSNVDDTVSETSETPKTGDSTKILGYIVLLLVSTLTLFVVVKMLRKKRMTKEVVVLLLLSLLLPAFSVVNAEENKETIKESITETHRLEINNKEYLLSTTVEAEIAIAEDTPIDEPDQEEEIPVTGVVYDDDHNLLTNETLRITNSLNDVQEVETDSEGYFVVRLKQGEEYIVTGNGLSSELIAVDVNDIQLTNSVGQISLGKTLINGDNKAILQPSTIHLTEEVAGQLDEVADDMSMLTFSGEIPLKKDDIFLLSEIEEYPTGLSLKVVSVTEEGGNTVVITKEPKLEEVFSAIIGDTTVKLTPEYFVPADGVTVESSEEIVEPMMRISSLSSIQSVEDVVKVNLGGLFPDDSPVNFKGSLELTGNFSGEIDWAAEIDLVDSWDFHFDGSQTLKGEFAGEWNSDNLNMFKPKRIGSFRIPTQVPGLMVHLPIDLVPRLEGKVSVEVMAGMRQDIGIKYADGDGVNTYPADKIQPIFNVSDLTGSGKASLGVKLSVLAEEAGIDLAGVSGEGGISADAKTSVAGPSGMFQCSTIQTDFYSKFLLEAPIIDWKSNDLIYEVNLGKGEFGNCVRSISANPSNLELAPGEAKSFTVTSKDGLNNVENVENKGNTLYSISDSNIIKVEKDEDSGQVYVVAAESAQDGDRETITISYNVHDKVVKDTITVNIVDNREKGTLVGKVIDAVSTESIQGASVKVYNGSRLVSDIKTQEDGTYETSLVPDTYKIKVTNPGYITDTSNVTVTATNTTTYDSKLQLVGDEYAGIGTASGTISNALTGEPITGITLAVREGRNNTSGEILKDLTTNEQGEYSVELPGGNYTIEISGEGYITTSTNILSIGDQTRGHQDAAVSPEGIIGDEIRVVLSWGESPRDIDSHLTGPTADGSRFHVYYSDKIFKDSENDVNLDIDDTSSYGPETVTVVKRINNGTYTYGVHNYSDRHELSDNYNLSNSEATVRVYSGNTLLTTYNVPINKEGNVWRVFEIRNGQIVPINQMDYISGWNNSSYFPPQS
ncbi:carboxypeptidase regulatory-like domain-containing protein [Aquibacillus rhizosphaerae]|uniref:Carboxypeptidase regulatory-like domain-containing protein n=1 Tax=Aquibacillus rhizosphaerae TaxID=3051431 RepID=A0ABT7L165_9BACI|nr:carboxypeptidase regulatory-like domain-containing protein [Aquibacillus sp. LR5S19]MDL4838927.1 carboxypeptidase regulatory-like domain-containing protein [Aquibacillus sp. LR5S19]